MPKNSTGPFDDNIDGSPEKGINWRVKVAWEIERERAKVREREEWENIKEEKMINDCRAVNRKAVISKKGVEVQDR